MELNPKSKKELANEMYEQTIDQLKTEIAGLRKALEVQSNQETKQPEREESVPLASDKIDEIQQKFSAFEMMYIQSQQEFVTTFKNLDERQKDYMNNIQDTIKGIVEQSLGRYDRWSSTAKSVEVPELEGMGSNQASEQNRDSDSDIVQMHNADETNEESGSANSSSKLVTNHAKDDTIHYPTVRSGDDVDNISDDAPKPARRKKKKKRVSKDTAILEFEQRLHQYGVDVNSTGLTTPRSITVAKEILNEREEIKKVKHSLSHKFEFLLIFTIIIRHTKLLLAHGTN